MRASKVAFVLLTAFVCAHITDGDAVGAGDHLKCYKVKDKTRTPVPGAPAVVDLSSSTGLVPGLEQGCTVIQKKAKFCCDSVSKTPSRPPAGVPLNERFCCYKVKCITPTPKGTMMTVNEQFRQGDVEIAKPFVLCAPDPGSPPTTTSTTVTTTSTTTTTSLPVIPCVGGSGFPVCDGTCTTPGWVCSAAAGQCRCGPGTQGCNSGGGGPACGDHLACQAFGLTSCEVVFVPPASVACHCE